jgi:hypothetical protein
MSLEAKGYYDDDSKVEEGQVDLDLRARADEVAEFALSEESRETLQQFFRTSYLVNNVPTPSDEEDVEAVNTFFNMCKEAKEQEQLVNEVIARTTREMAALGEKLVSNGVGSTIPIPQLSRRPRRIWAYPPIAATTRPDSPIPLSELFK